MRILIDAIILLKRAHTNFVVTLTVVLLIAYAVLNAYLATTENYFWMFLVASGIFFYIATYSISGWREKEIPAKDVVGNIAVSCFGLYFLTYVIATILATYA